MKSQVANSTDPQANWLSWAQLDSSLEGRSDRTVRCKRAGGTRQLRTRGRPCDFLAANMRVLRPKRLISVNEARGQSRTRKTAFVRTQAALRWLESAESKKTCRNGLHADNWTPSRASGDVGVPYSTGGFPTESQKGGNGAALSDTRPSASLVTGHRTPVRPFHGRRRRRSATRSHDTSAPRPTTSNPPAVND